MIEQVRLIMVAVIEMEEGTVQVDYILLLFPQRDGVMVEQILNLALRETLHKDNMPKRIANNRKDGSNPRKRHLGRNDLPHKVKRSKLQ